ncbi:Uncharacterized protein FWK35_00011901 [Aphis craccivora]|uniref:Uncharacterized protein n=1 Tax=Aphis craccivora TaxID=307492 RepID=A0A6G0YLC9_APHCR|nr:Uncharacterized protein FWK35_00011901 [Aphis craccivora]
MIKYSIRIYGYTLLVIRLGRPDTFYVPFQRTLYVNFHYLQKLTHTIKFRLLEYLVLPCIINSRYLLPIGHYNICKFYNMKLIHEPRVDTYYIDNRHSQRSDECIDFTMMCVLFCVYSITSRNNGSISNFGGGFRWQMTEKREFLRKTSFRPNRFFYMVLRFFDADKIFLAQSKYLKI